MGGGQRPGNLSLNVSKIKELIVDYRKRRTEHSPIHKNGAVMEQVESFKFLGIHITKNLSWSKQTNIILKRADNAFSPSGG